LDLLGVTLKSFIFDRYVAQHIFHTSLLPSV